MSTLGVFDSGLGGLSVLRELRRELPGQRTLYLADGAHCPYGERSDDDIRRLTHAGVAWLREQGAEVVVIACNTASAYSLAELRAWAGADMALIGLVPALKPAAAQTRSGVVGVLATRATLRGGLLAEAERAYTHAAGVRTLHLSHPELVPRVEAGEAHSPGTRALLAAVLAPLLRAGGDALVLGCTHFPFLAGSIRAVAPGLVLHDSGAGVARRAHTVLRERGLRRGGEEPGALRLYTTGDAAQASAVGSALLDEPLQFCPVVLNPA